MAAVIWQPFLFWRLVTISYISLFINLGSGFPLASYSAFTHMGNSNGTTIKVNLLNSHAFPKSKCTKCITPRVRPQAGHSSPASVLDRHTLSPWSKKSTGSSTSASGASMVIQMRV